MDLNNQEQFDQENRLKQLSGNPRNMDDNTFHESPEEDEDATSYGTDRNQSQGNDERNNQDDDSQDQDFDDDLDQDDLSDDFNNNSFDRDAFDTE